MTLTKTQQLTTDLCALLDAVELSVDEKIKAIGMARSHLQGRRDPELEAWRKQRAEQGVIGSAKKSDAIRSELVTTKKSPPRNK